MKKITSILILLCMCLTSLIACGTTGEGDVTTTLAGDATTPEEVPTGPSIPTGDLTQGDLGGETIKFLAWEDAPNLEFEFEESNIDQATINDAILQRNINVETRLNCKLAFTYAKGNYDNKNIFVTKAESFASCQSQSC